MKYPPGYGPPPTPPTGNEERHWVSGVGWKPGPAPPADSSRADNAKRDLKGTRASSRVRRESGRFADLQEDAPKKKKKKKGANQYTKAKERGDAPPSKKQKKSKEPKRIAETTTSEGQTGAIVEMSQKDAAMTCQRRLRATLVEPPYDLELVPDAKRDLTGSALRRVEGTASWEKLLAEAMLLCNEAAWRRLGKDRGGSQTNQRTELSPPDAKPLMLEYILRSHRHGRAVVGLRGPNAARSLVAGLCVCHAVHDLVPLFPLDGLCAGRGRHAR